MKNHWKRISRRLIYKNHWVRFFEDKVITPNGEKGIYAYYQKSVGLIIVPVDAHENFYLVGQWRYPIGKYSWEFPMGGQESAETLLSAAKRELNEETGFIAKKWKNIGHFYFSNGSTDQIGRIYMAKDFRRSLKLMSDKTEQIKIKKVSLKKMSQLILSNEITDSPTITAFYKYLLNEVIK